MRTSSSQNDKKTFRDDLFEKLANDYILKGRSSVLARFLRDDTQESVEKLKQEAESEGQEPLADSVSVIPGFCFYYQLFQESSRIRRRFLHVFQQLCERSPGVLSLFFMTKTSSSKCNIFIRQIITYIGNNIN